MRELWCIKEKEVFPSAESATSAMVGLIEEELGKGNLLHGPPTEVRALPRGSDRLAAPLATGLVAIIRSEVDDSTQGCLERLRGQAWQVQHSLDDCLVVKALGRNSNHAKELNWLATVVDSYIKEGLPLSVAANQIKLGYYSLRAHVARDNGAEWAGAVYGINLAMAELNAIVQWAES